MLDVAMNEFFLYTLSGVGNHILSALVAVVNDSIGFGLVEIWSKIFHDSILNA